MAQPGTSNPWWNPNQYTGPGGYDWGQTPYGQSASEAAPEAAWLRYGAGIGAGGGETAFDKWFRQQFGNAMTGYQAATISDPLLDINTYFGNLGNMAYWQNLFQSRTTPGTRGEETANFGAPVRWIPR